MANDAEPPSPLNGTGGRRGGRARHGLQVAEHGAIERDTLGGIGVVRAWPRKEAVITPLPAQDLLDRRAEIVVTKPAKHASEIAERKLVGFQKCLLRGMQKGTVKCRAAGHTAHGKPAA
jgi:hypothetical protein